MRATVINCVLLGFGVLAAAQQPPTSPSVRSIKFRLIATSNKNVKPISPELIAAGLKAKGINLAIEGRFEPAEAEKATYAIRDMYRRQGNDVRVEHSASRLHPGGIEVAFEVVELSSCN